MLYLASLNAAMLLGTKTNSICMCIFYIFQVASMDRQAADGGSIINVEKHDSRTNEAQVLVIRRSSDMAQDAKNGKTDNIAVTTGSMASGTNSSPACRELTRTRSVEKFVYETDKSQLPVVVRVDPVSNSLSHSVLSVDTIHAFTVN